MNVLNKHAIVPFSTHQMFELVNSIEDYPRFLPWCHSSTIIERTKKEVVASLQISWKGMSKTFTTRNILHPYERMEIKLVKGPLKHLDGLWSFQKFNHRACKVTLDLEFEFAGNLIDMLFQPVFQHIANTLVESFCKRAVDIYGNE